MVLLSAKNEIGYFCKHMIGEDLDEEFKKEIDRKVEGIQENLNHEKGDDFLNEKIREEETEAVVCMW